jgi:hypothetical protein
MNNPEIEDTENEDESEAEDQRSIWARDPYTRGLAKEARRATSNAVKAVLGAAKTSTDPDVREALGRYEVALQTQRLFDIAEGKS